MLIFSYTFRDVSKIEELQSDADVGCSQDLSELDVLVLDVSGETAVKTGTVRNEGRRMRKHLAITLVSMQ